MKRDFDLIALDGEMSGSDASVHSLLSIGCVRVSNMDKFYAEIRQHEFMVNPEAMRVNGLNILTRDDAILETAEQVDERLSIWLKQSPFYQEGKKYNLIPVGLNVGAFDMAFVRKFLPKSAALFGYRSLDLNALIFADAIRHQTTFKSLKHAAKEIGKSFAHHYVPDLAPHNALYDAYMNVGMLEYALGDLSGEKISLGEAIWEGGHVAGAHNE